MPKITKIKKKKKVKKSLVKKVAGKKFSVKKIKTKVDKKAENPPLRIANSNKYTPEEKVEIKKIKKQATEKGFTKLKIT